MVCNSPSTGLRRAKRALAPLANGATSMDSTARALGRRALCFMVVLGAVAAAVGDDSLFSGPFPDRCGPGVGDCAKGECCSVYGYCGTTVEHCAPLYGCQQQCWPACGDSICDAGSYGKNGVETCSSCPADCGFCAEPVCGDGKCDSTWLEDGESCGNCPSDCGPCQFTGRVVRECAQRDTIALTINGAPSYGTSNTLDILSDIGVPATLAVVGNQAASNAWALSRAVDEGHSVITLTSSFANLVDAYPGLAATEASLGADQISWQTCVRPNVLRPPFDAMDASKLAAMNRAGFAVFSFNMDSEDWKDPDNCPNTFLNAITSYPYPSIVYVLSDWNPSLVRTIPKIVDAARYNGYRFVTAEECLYGADFATHPAYVFSRRDCDPDPMPIATGTCPVSDWSDWSPCDAKCGSGTSTRVRYTIPVAHHRVSPACASTTLIESRACEARVLCDASCAYSAWSDWSSCSEECHGGTRRKTRQLVSTQSYLICSSLVSVELCNTQPCSTNGGKPVDCVVGPWTEFSSCSKTCGGGTSTRTRAVVTPSSGGGKVCPSLQESQTCNTTPCNSQCVLSEWGAWSTCDADCSGGSRSRSRTVVSPGANCGPLTDTQACNTAPCPVACTVSAWSAWSPCSSECDSGTRTRSRTVVTSSGYGGDDCPVLSESQVCNTQACDSGKPPCPVSEWSDWSSCLGQCGKDGYKERHRTLGAAPSYDTAPCPPLSETSTCTVDCSPACIVSPWSAWSACTKACGGGTTTHTRTVVSPTDPAAVAAAYCPTLAETRACNAQPCPIQCEMSPWGSWDTCSSPCGEGKYKRSRSVLVPCSHGAQPCGPTVDVGTCSASKACDSDCAYSAWSAWSTCTAPCGGTGMTKRTRTKTGGGSNCGEVSQEVPCNGLPCPVDCVLDAWSAWTPCSGSCGQGLQTRSRGIVQPERYGGVTCEGMYEEQVCDSPSCSVNPCVLSDWSAWSTCGNKTSDCDSGYRSRSRQQIQPADQSASPCGSLVDYDRTGCPSSSLPSTCSPACAFTEWTNQGSCSATCGTTGVQLQTRTRIAAGSQDCSTHPMQQYVPCNRNPCPVDCAVGDWGDWSPCTTSCGGGTRVRSRPVITKATNGGTACPALTEVAPCNTATCAYNSSCVLSAWSSWQACSKTCGGGEQQRQRSVVVAPTLPGVDCEALVDRQPCNTGPCTGDNNSTCPVSEWGPWSSCSVTCVHDTQTRSRALLSSSNCKSPVLTEVTNCTTAWCPTPVDCRLSDWSSWSVCSVGCGKGTQSRYRQVLVTPANSGAACGVTYDTKACTGASTGSACNAGAPAVNCAISPWSAWDACSAQCGGGMVHQYATVITAPSGPGTACPTLVKSQACNTESCNQPSNNSSASTVIVVGKYLTSSVSSTSWTLRVSAIPDSYACNWTQTSSYTDATATTSRSDATTVLGALSSGTECAPTGTFTKEGVYSYLVLALNPYTAILSRQTVVVWVPRLIKAPAPTSGSNCYHGTACDVVQAWSFLPLPPTRTVNPSLLATAVAPTLSLTLSILLQDTDANHPRVAFVDTNQVGVLNPASSLTGSYVITTSWSVPVAAKASNTYSASVTLTESLGTSNTLFSATVEGDSFSIKFPYVVQYGSYSSCPSSCGYGMSTRNASCLLAPTSAVVPIARCAGLTMEVAQPCITVPCEAAGWVTSQWSACSTTSCGGTQSRTVTCTSNYGAQLPLSSCAGVPQPASTRSCSAPNTDCRSFGWEKGSWQTCRAASGTGTSGSCSGFQHRYVACRSGSTLVANSKCGRPVSADLQQSCTTTCPGRYQVRAEPWQACSKTCGGGVTSRTVTCWDTQTNSQAPISSCTGGDTSTSAVCNVEPCITASWRVTPLLKCHKVKDLVGAPYYGTKVEYAGLTHTQFVNSTSSLYCGGVQFRTVECVSSTGSVVADSNCASAPKPSLVLPCGTCSVCAPAWLSVYPNQASKFVPCSGHGTCSNNGTTCQCSPGWTGPICNKPSTCSGAATANGTCCPYNSVLDKDGHCCSGVLDKRGSCCVLGRLNGCGECSAAIAVMDHAGQCCAGSLAASGACCPSPSVLDQCGVCGGMGACSVKYNVRFRNVWGFTVGSILDAGTPQVIGLRSDVWGFCANRTSHGTSNVNLGSFSVSVLSGTSSSRLLQSSPAVNTGVSVDVTFNPVQNGKSNALSTADLMLAMSSKDSSPSTSTSNSLATAFLDATLVDVIGTCGNGICEVGERCAGVDPFCCQADCPVPQSVCPSSGSSALPCSGNGLCVTSVNSAGVCNCFAGQGWTGESCSECLPGFSLVGSTCVASFPANALAAPGSSSNQGGDKNDVAGPKGSTSSGGSIGSAGIVAIVIVVVGALIVALVVVRWRATKKEQAAASKGKKGRSGSNRDRVETVDSGMDVGDAAHPSSKVAAARVPSRTRLVAVRGSDHHTDTADDDDDMLFENPHATKEDDLRNPMSPSGVAIGGVTPGRSAPASVASSGLRHRSGRRSATPVRYEDEDDRTQFTDPHVVPQRRASNDDDGFDDDRLGDAIDVHPRRGSDLEEEPLYEAPSNKPSTAGSSGGQSAGKRVFRIPPIEAFTAGADGKVAEQQFSDGDTVQDVGTEDGDERISTFHVTAKSRPNPRGYSPAPAPAPERDVVTPGTDAISAMFRATPTPTPTGEPRTASAQRRSSAKGKEKEHERRSLLDDPDDADADAPSHFH